MRETRGSGHPYGIPSPRAICGLPATRTDVCVRSPAHYLSCVFYIFDTPIHYAVGASETCRWCSLGKKIIFMKKIIDGNGLRWRELSGWYRKIIALAYCKIKIGILPLQAIR